MDGTRLPDGTWEGHPGDYSKHVEVKGKGRVVFWLVWPPGSLGPCIIGRPNADGSDYHWVRENDDGTITVEPNPPDAPEARRNSNSIQFAMWHGYIYDGVWTPA